MVSRAIAVFLKLRTARTVNALSKFLLRDHPENETNVASQAAVALGEIGGEACADVLLAFIRREYKEYEVRSIGPAIQALGKTGVPSAIAPLTEILQNRRAPRDLRTAAIIGLARLRCAPPLIDVLLSDDDREVRRMAALYMHDTGDSDLILPPLRKAVEDTDERVRHEAINGIARLKSADAADLLHSLLANHPDEYVRLWAAIDLSKGGDRIAEEFLRERDEHLRHREEKKISSFAIKDRDGRVVYTVGHSSLGAGGALAGAELSGADLRMADLTRADLCETNLERSDLAGAILRNAKLYAANLIQAHLRSADLRGADLTAAGLAGAIMDGAIYDGATKWPEGYNPVDHGAVNAGR